MPNTFLLTVKMDFPDGRGICFAVKSARVVSHVLAYAVSCGV